jgi:D-alanine transaminase
MGRIAYVDGRYLPHQQAAVRVEDRGFQFADGVYEVIAVRRGRPVDEDDHLDRLDRSLRELRMPWPMSRRALRLVMRETIRRNHLGAFGALYLQVTRGAAPRSHAFPATAKQTVVMTARPLSLPTAESLGCGIGVVTVADIRWKRCDVKSVSLLATVLGKQVAVEAGCYEAWMVDEQGLITEGTASNAWIVTAGGELVTRRADTAILNGITRMATIGIARAAGLRFVERPFSVAEAKGAAEAFITSTTSMIRPVIRIDGVAVGSGRPGGTTVRLVDWYLDHVEAEGRTV